MYGFSIFLNKDFDEQVCLYIDKMIKAGFKGIFSSLHIPEEEATLYKEKLVKLGKIAKERQLNLTVDISGHAIKNSGFSIDNIEELKSLGVTGLRMDYGFSNAMIAKVSQKLTVCLNASTVTQNDIDELKEKRANFNHLEAWHNYYPRPETGLSLESFVTKNKFLKRNNFKIMAFVPGDDNLRQPLYKGLPTLENHRFKHPLACLIDMKILQVDHVYIGDGGIKDSTILQNTNYINENKILLRAQAKTNDFDYVLGEHENRQDEARDVIRSAQSRLREISKIIPENTVTRKKGSITMDNCDYGRYMGEVQITKDDLIADSKVNVLGNIIDEDLDLISCIGSGQKFIIEKGGK